MTKAQQAKETLKRAGYLNVYWHVDDILQQAEEMEITLTDEQLNDVILEVENTDQNIGVNWDIIEIAIKQATQIEY
jgi:hypothetical protein